MKGWRNGLGMMRWQQAGEHKRGFQEGEGEEHFYEYHLYQEPSEFSSVYCSLPYKRYFGN